METLNPRRDRPGAWHHVTNRGLARRPAFEGIRDVRCFLSLLARRVREGQLEVHAFAILTTHFHLLVRSPRGELSNAMMWVENQYVKRFNRLRDRDGSLFKSRFRSRRVDTDEYWFNVVRYIDANPVAAGLVHHAQSYAHGSARIYAGARTPPWFDREEVERTVARMARRSRFEASDYVEIFCQGGDPNEAWIVERRIESGAPHRGGVQQENELLRGAPNYVIDWLTKRTQLAEGRNPGLVVAAPAQVEGAVRSEAALDPGWRCGGTRTCGSAWAVLEAGLWQKLCGLTLFEIAARSRVSRSGAALRCRQHLRWAEVDALYRQRLVRVVHLIKQQRERARAPTPRLLGQEEHREPPVRTSQPA